jgi:WD40 repeat protein
MGHTGGVFCLCTDGLDSVYSGGADWKVKMWDAGSHESVKVFAGHNNSVRALAWMPSSIGSTDGELWSAGDDNTVRVWHREKEEEIVVLEQKAPVVCMSAGTGSVWSGGQDGGACA